jgi:prefoldin subunit 5
MSVEGQQVVDVNSLSIEELQHLQQQLNAEITFFNESLNELRNVSSKFGRCQVTLESINKDEKNKPAMIPLSESVKI